MRIALVTPYFPPRVGGIETYTYELSKRLSRENEVYVFTSGGDVTETCDGAKVFRLRTVDLQNLPLPPKIPYPMPISLMARLARSDVDVIHAHGHAFLTSLHAAVAARLAHRPFVLTVHDVGVAYQGHIVMRGFRPIVDSTMAEYIFRKADVVISQNETTRRYASRFRPRRMITIPQGVDLDRFEPREEGEAVAFVAARLVPQKGGEIFVKAVPKVIEEIGEARFMVIGEGVQKRYLENLAYDLGVAEYIEFVGRIPHMKVPEYLEQAKIVVFPSEIPTGLALLEAAAMKRAIIAVRNAWTVDSLGDAPVYVTALDPEETAHAIAYLLKNDDKRKAVAELVHETVGPEQDWDVVASKHLEIYSQLVDGKWTS